MKTERQQDKDVAERLRRENLERTNAPKDNEVDEKVEDFFDRLYGMTFRLFLDQNSEEDEGNTVELRLAATVDNLALFEMQDHAVLYSAATVAELRAKADAAERRVAAALELAQKWQDKAADSWGEDKDDAARQQCCDELRATLTGADPT